MGCQSSKYTRKYTPSTTITSSKSMKAKSKEGDCAFFAQARAKMSRDYILVVDRSGSMSDKWTEAQAAVEFFACSICEYDPTGITLIMFDNDIKKFENVKDPEVIKKHFNENPPSGSTDLAGALDVAFKEHFGGTRGATTILVITDGTPDDQNAVTQTITKAANSITSDEELSVSIIQIGNDSSARQFLHSLDDDLNTKFDIVDTLVPSDLREMSFADVIKKSLTD